MKKIKVPIWFWKWINTWADMDDRKEAVINNRITDYGRGYKQAIMDVFGRVKVAKK